MNATKFLRSPAVVSNFNEEVGIFSNRMKDKRHFSEERNDCIFVWCGSGGFASRSR